MTRRGLGKVIDHLRQALVPPNGGGLSDGQLLARFVSDREEAAFEAMVKRHGPMVLGVCRRILGHVQDAEDAFQAAFLVLARKAASVVKREALASFLYGVAYRTALRARARVAKRQAAERQVEHMPHPAVASPEAQDWRPVLDRELELLPEKYRAPVVVCDLEGKTRREAARQLGLSEGTLSSRLARARRLLAKRLSRHGVALSGGALAVALAEGASAAVPAALAAGTVKAAVLVAAGKMAAAGPAAILMKEVLETMLIRKLKVAIFTAVVAVLLGAGGLVYRAAGQAPAPEKRADNRPRTELEALHREIELLRLNLEVVLEKVRSQEAELRTLREQVKAGQAKTTLTTTLDSDVNVLRKTILVGNVDKGSEVVEILVDPTSVKPGVEEEIEEALKVLREAPKSDKARQRAAQALERALKKIREQPKPTGNGDPAAKH
jgi:RNA polymerase sigma factor (sigma-70 family)